VIPEIVGTKFGTIKIHHYAANTAGATLDLTAAGFYGPCDSVFVSIEGDDRAVQLNGNGLDMTVKDGRCPVFDIRCDEVVIGSGSSAELVVGCCYVDLWGT